MIGNAAAPVNLRVSLAGVVLNVCPEINTKLQLLSLLLGVLDFDGHSRIHQGKSASNFCNGGMVSVFYNVLNVKDVIEVDEPVVTPIGTPPELKLWAQSIEAQQISLELMANICTVDQEYTELGEVNEGVSMFYNSCKLCR